MAVFDWMEPARAKLNVDPAFRALGSADLVIGFWSGRHVRKVTFAAFGISSIDRIESTELDNLDVVIGMGTRQWRSYFHRRGIGIGPTLLSFDLEYPIVRVKDAMARRHFERVHMTIQAFVDAALDVEQ